MGQPGTLAPEDLNIIKRALAKTVPNALPLLDGYWRDYARHELQHSRQPMTEEQFWLTRILEAPDLAESVRDMFSLSNKQAPDMTDPAFGRIIDAWVSAWRIWRELIDLKLDALFAPHRLLAPDPALSNRSAPPPALTIDDSALLDEMHAMRAADPALSVWKLAEAMASRADGKPGSSLRSRRDRLIDKFKERPK